MLFHSCTSASRSSGSVSGDEHVYRVLPITVQLVTDPVIMPAKEEHDVILVQNVLTTTNHVTSCIGMLKDVIKVSLLQKGQNDRINNIVSAFYDIKCSLNNFEMSATIVRQDKNNKHQNTCLHYTNSKKDQRGGNNVSNPIVYTNALGTCKSYQRPYHIYYGTMLRGTMAKTEKEILMSHAKGNHDKEPVEYANGKGIWKPYSGH